MCSINRNVIVSRYRHWNNQIMDLYQSNICEFKEIFFKNNIEFF